MLKVTSSVLALLFLCSAARADEGTKLLGEALRTAVAGKTITLTTPAGSLPISYRTNGTMVGKAANLAQFVGSDKDTGRWWATGTQLCQKWTTWLDGQAYCYRISRNGDTVHWSRNDGRTGIATITN